MELTSEKAKEMLMKVLQKAKEEEIPYDVANGSRGWDQADHTPGMDTLANEIGIMEDELTIDELSILKGSEEEPEPFGIIENPYDGSPEVEMVEPKKLNRHERRKRAKLARMLAMKEKLEAEKRKRKVNYGN